MPANGAKIKRILVEFTSQTLKRAGYVPKKRRMVLEFRNGGIYSYGDIKLPLFTCLALAESPGRFFNLYIRPAHRATCIAKSKTKKKNKKR